MFSPVVRVFITASGNKDAKALHNKELGLVDQEKRSLGNKLKINMVKLNPV